jgi:hypothetical protein
MGTHGFLITVGDIIHLLGRSNEVFAHWAKSIENRILDEVSRTIIIRTLPEEAFDQRNSVFWLNHESERTSGLMKLGNGQDFGCLIHFVLAGKPDMPSRGGDSCSGYPSVGWYCRFVPTTLEFGKKTLRYLDGEKLGAYFPLAPRWSVIYGPFVATNTSSLVRHVHFKYISSSDPCIEDHGLVEGLSNASVSVQAPSEV